MCALMVVESMARVLIVEDNEMNRDMLSRRLERRGYDILLAEDAEQGIEVAQMEQPDIILMDVSLPGMNGWDATRQLKASAKTAEIPIVALTAHALSTDREKATEAGCDAYETKPVELPTLISTIERLLAR